MNTKKFLTAVVAVSALFATGSAFAGGHHRGEDHNSGIRLAADIVHLVKSVVTPTVVVQQPSPAVVVQRAVAVHGGGSAAVAGCGDPGSVADLLLQSAPAPAPRTASSQTGKMVRRSGKGFGKTLAILPELW